MKKVIFTLMILILVLTGCSTSNPLIEQSVQQTQMPQTSQESNEEIYLNVVLKNNLGKPIFEIETNLPDEISLMITLEDNMEYGASDKVIVSNGCGSAGPFTSSGSALNGNYTLTITTPYAAVMPSSVKEIIGANGELMTGKFIHGFDTGTDKRVAVCYDFKIEESSNDEVELNPYFEPFITLSENTSVETTKQKTELTQDMKMEILSFINGQLDPLSETDMSDESLEKKAEEVWIEAEQKFKITEADILDIMTDSDLIKKYYANQANTNQANTNKSSNVDVVVTNYEATLDNNGNDVTVGATENFISEFVRYVGEENYDAINEMITNGYLAKIPHGTKINIAELGFGISKVDILEGGLKGTSVYVINECIKEK